MLHKAGGSFSLLWTYRWKYCPSCFWSLSGINEVLELFFSHGSIISRFQVQPHTVSHCTTWWTSRWRTSHCLTALSRAMTHIEIQDSSWYHIYLRLYLATCLSEGHSRWALICRAMLNRLDFAPFWQGSWIVKQSVGKKACLVGQALEINYFRGANYLEVKSHVLHVDRFICWDVGSRTIHG